MGLSTFSTYNKQCPISHFFFPNQRSFPNQSPPLCDGTFGGGTRFSPLNKMEAVAAIVFQPYRATLRNDEYVLLDNSLRDY